MNENMQQIKEYLKDPSVVCALRHNGTIYTATESGIKPLMNWIKEQPEILKESDIADKVIGRAAALLMVYGGVKEVYANILSEPAGEILKQYRIAYTYETLVPNIINRTGTDICPMEKACLSITDPKEAYEILKQKIREI